MKIQYSSREKDKLLRILENGRYLGDIDLFLDLAHKIQKELEELQRRAHWCIHRLDEEICSLRQDVDRAQGQISEARQAIRNTPTSETVFPNPDSVQKGERPITRTINQDKIAKYNDSIAYQQREIERYNSRLELLKQNKSDLQSDEGKISQYLSVTADAVKWLSYARKNAETDCKEYKRAVENAAICMENYINVRSSYSSFEAVRHIEPKEGW